MKERAWWVFACVGGLTLLGFTGFAFSRGVFPFAVRTAVTAATLASDPNEPPDPCDANDRTGIAGLVGYPDPNDPNQDPNDPCSVPPLGGVVVHAVQNGEIIGSAVTGDPNMPEQGYYWVARMQPGTYDLQVIPPGYAAKMIPGISVSFGWPTVTNIFDLVPEGRITGRVTNAADEPFEPNKIYVSVDCGNGVTITVRPDPNGDYAIGNLPAGTYTVNADSRLARFEPRSDIQVSSGVTTTGCDFQAVAEGRISGRVIDCIGQPIGPNDITIMVNGAAGVVRGAEPNTDGYYLVTNVAEGNYVVSASSVGYSLPAACNVVVSLGHETPNVDFQALAAGVVTGRVLASDGVTPIPGALVTVEPTPEGRDPSVATADPNGCYALRNVPPGQGYVVRARYGSDPNDPNTLHTVGRTSGVAVLAGQTTAPVDVTAPAGAISGTVSPAITGAIVVATCGAAGLSWTVSPAANGTYTLSNLPAGLYEVSLKAAGYFAPRLSGVQVTQGETTGHNLVATIEGSISGHVGDASAGPIPGAVVSAIGDGADPNRIGFPAVTDPNGDYVLGHLAAGSYTVYVEADGYVGDSAIGVTVATGQTTPGVDFAMTTSGGSISGTVYASDGVTPVAGAFVVCLSPGGTLATSATGGDGRYGLGPLLPGLYSVMVAAQGFEGGQAPDVSVSTGDTPGIDVSLETAP
jgi:large repetitive protein